jgi:hypothetical protein
MSSSEDGIVTAEWSSSSGLTFLWRVPGRSGGERPSCRRIGTLLASMGGTGGIVDTEDLRSPAGLGEFVRLRVSTGAFSLTMVAASEKYPSMMDDAIFVERVRCWSRRCTLGLTTRHGLCAHHVP